MDTIYTLDSELITGAVAERAQSALEVYEGGGELSWDQAELAIYLVFMYGELGGKEKGTLHHFVHRSPGFDSY